MTATVHTFEGTDFVLATDINVPLTSGTRISIYNSTHRHLLGVHKVSFLLNGAIVFGFDGADRFVAESTFTESIAFRYAEYDEIESDTVLLDVFINTVADSKIIGV
jgi:hypothetical protein